MKVGRYELVKRLDRGFLGPLWVVRFDHEGESLLGMARVVELDADSPDEIREQLTESAWEAPELSGRGAVCAADVVFEDDRFALISDYVEGQPLSALESMRKAKRVKLPIELALRFGLDLIAAVESLAQDARDASIDACHGGVGLDTILVGTDGKIYMLDPLVAATATTFESFKMRPERAPYVAPEQWQSKPADEKSDVYSVACIVWELLANRRIHVGGPSTIQRRLLDGEALPELPARPGVSQNLVSLLSNATSLDPKQRPSLEQLGKGLLAAGKPASHAEASKFVEALAKAQLTKQRAASEHSAIGRVAELVRQERARAPLPNSPPTKWRPVWTKTGKRDDGGLRGRSAAASETSSPKAPAVPRIAPPKAVPPPAPARRTAARGTLLGLSPVQLAAASALAVETGPDSEEPTQVVALAEQGQLVPPVSRTGRQLASSASSGPHVPNEHPTPVVPRNAQVPELPPIAPEPLPMAPEPPPMDRVSRPARSANAAPTFEDVVVAAPSALEAPSALTATELNELVSERTSDFSAGRQRGSSGGQFDGRPRHSDSEVTPRPLALPPMVALKRAPPVVWFMAGICTTLVGVIIVLLLREPPITYPAVAAQPQATAEPETVVVADQPAAGQHASAQPVPVQPSGVRTAGEPSDGKPDEAPSAAGADHEPKTEDGVEPTAASDSQSPKDAREDVAPSVSKTAQPPRKKQRVYRPKRKKKANSDFIPKGL